MKTKLTLLIILFITTTVAIAQQGINYKALIKDNLGNLVTNQNVTVQFTILEGTTNVYLETHSPTTDANGLVIVNIGEGTTSNVFADINWSAADHFLNVQVDTGSGLVDFGTTQFMAVPYALSAANVSGLEALNEGNGIGYRLKDTDPSYYGNIGDRAVDLSYGGDSGYDEGSGAYGTGSVAMGQYTSAGNGSVAMGYQSTASGQYATAMGNVTTASGLFSTTAGFYTTASAAYSTVFGSSTIADDQNGMAVGMFNDNTVASNTLFQVGNGTSTSSRSNAFVVDSDGIITAPSFDMAEITDNKALITKEYADANYSGGGSGTNPTGLEVLNEGNGNGWRLVGRDADRYGDVGLHAIDLSISNTISNTYGATGLNSFAIGYQSISSGNGSVGIGTSANANSDNSIAIGFSTYASNDNATAIGYNTTASGFASTALGLNTISDDDNSTVVGRFNDNIASASTIFQVGNGVDTNNRSNALTVDLDGTIIAPSFDVSEITSPKALITKEYLDINGASGLEAIDEGNGTGWRLIGKNPNNYGAIGENAVDLSFSNSSSTILGATGFGSLAVGTGVEASGNYSFSQGGSTQASGLYAAALGFATVASGSQSIAMGGFSSASATFSAALGRGTIADDNNSTVVGVYNDNTTSISTVFQVGNGNSNTNRSNAFTVYQSGNALLAGTLIQNSDRRLKKDINNLDYGLYEVLKLKPVSYHWKKHPNQLKSLGLIAQEVQTVINEIVHVAEDKDKTLSLSYTELIPVLIKAIQEQQAIIESQKITLSAQKQTNTEQSKVLQTLLERVEALENKTVISSRQELAKN